MGTGEAGLMHHFSEGGSCGLSDFSEGGASRSFLGTEEDFGLGGVLSSRFNTSSRFRSSSDIGKPHVAQFRGGQPTETPARKGHLALNVIESRSHNLMCGFATGQAKDQTSGEFTGIA
jgi:hypothetical protein